MLGIGRITYLDDDNVDPREDRITKMMADAVAPEEEMAMVVKDTDAIYQGNPLGLPSGFFAVKTPMGKRLGFGFYCKRCKLHIPGRAPHDVKHCGKITSLPDVVKKVYNVHGLRIFTKRGMRETLSLLEKAQLARFNYHAKTVVVRGG